MCVGICHSSFLSPVFSCYSQSSFSSMPSQTKAQGEVLTQYCSFCLVITTDNRIKNKITNKLNIYDLLLLLISLVVSPSHLTYTHICCPLHPVYWLPNITFSLFSSSFPTCILLWWPDVTYYGPVYSDVLSHVELSSRQATFTNYYEGPSLASVNIYSLCAAASSVTESWTSVSVSVTASHSCIQFFNASKVF